MRCQVRDQPGARDLWLRDVLPYYDWISPTIEILPMYYMTGSGLVSSWSWRPEPEAKRQCQFEEKVRTMTLLIFLGFLSTESGI